MMERFEYQGFWWLPDTPDNRVPGTLVFDPEEGAALDLLGSLRGLEDISTPLNPELILGTSSDGRPITLKECSRDRGTLSIGAGFSISSFSARMVIVGEDYEVTLSFGGNRKWTAPPLTEVILTQPAELAVRFSEKQPLQDLLDIAYDIQHFLSLGMRGSVHPVAVWGASGLAGEAVRVAVHYRPLGRAASAQERPVRHRMLFSLRDLPQGFGPAMRRWLEKSDVLGPVFRLYLGTVYNPQAFLEQQFLSLVQALEVYHRRAMATPELPEEQHERRKEEILEAVPERHREWLEGRLEYSNEPGLSKRIKEIIRRYPGSAYPVVGENSRTRNSFLYKVVATRNYRTHFDQSLEEQAVREIGELYEISRKLRKLLEICLLGEIGFEDAQIAELLGRRL